MYAITVTVSGPPSLLIAVWLLVVLRTASRASTRHSTLSSQLHSFSSSLERLHALHADLEPRVAAEASRVQDLQASSVASAASSASSAAASAAACSAAIAAATSELESRLRAEFRQRELAQTELHESHASALGVLTSTVQSLQVSLASASERQGALLDPLRAQLGSLASQGQAQCHQLQALSLLATSSMPKQIDKVAAQAAENLAALAARVEARAIEASKAASSDLSLKLEAQSLAQRSSEARFDGAQSSLANRLGRLEESFRALPPPPPPAPSLEPKVTHLFVQLDRLEAQVENLAKNGANGNAAHKKGGPSKPQTPATNNTEAEDK